MPELDPTLLRILGANSQLPDLQPLAHALAQKHMEELAAEHERDQRLSAEAARRLQSIALDDPANVRTRRALEAPVAPFQPERPPALGAPAVKDANTLSGAFEAPPESTRVVPVNMGPNGPTRGGPPTLQFGDLTLTDGAFAAPQTAPEAVSAPPANQLRQPLVKREGTRNYDLARRDVTRSQRSPTNDMRPDLSPEGLAMYEKLAPELVKRRQTEEATRRGLEVGQLNVQGKAREAALRSATDLLRTQMELTQKAQLARIRAQHGTKDDTRQWFELAQKRLQAANELVMHYKSGFAAPDDPQVSRAIQDRDEAQRDFDEAVRASRGRLPGAGAAPAATAGGTKKFVLGPNGQLVPQ